MREHNNLVHKTLILSQNGTFCYQIIEESFTKELPLVDAYLIWKKLNKNFKQILGAPNMQLCRNFTRCAFKNVMKDPEYWITNWT